MKPTRLLGYEYRTSYIAIAAFACGCTSIVFSVAIGSMWPGRIAFVITAALIGWTFFRERRSRRHFRRVYRDITEMEQELNARRERS